MRRDWVRLSPHSPDEAAILSTEARFRAVISRFRSYAGRLPYRELDHALSLTDTGADVLTGRNGRRLLVGLLAPAGLRPSHRARGRERRQSFVP